MPDASLENITEFLATKRLAIVGVSRDSGHFSRGLLREFVAQGYDVVPVNPQAKEIEGRRCFARVADITPPVKAALLMTPVSETDQALCACNEADIRKIWIYKTCENSPIQERAVDVSRLRGAAVIQGHCPYMFLPKPAFVHRVHRFFMKMVGSYPR